MNRRKYEVAVVYRSLIAIIVRNLSRRRYNKAPDDTIAFSWWRIIPQTFT